MSDLWLSGDSSIQPSSLHLALDQFIDDSLGPKRQLYLSNGSSWICKFFQKNACARGQDCPYRHSKGDKPTVCKYWLRGQCKKGADTCESLHIYDLSKMPMCQFVLDYGVCNNADCLFNHVKAEADEVDCIWYSRGFCKRGPLCKNRHRKREMCPDYLAGFCELGPQCEKGHPKWLLPEESEPDVQYDISGRIIPRSITQARSLFTLVGMKMSAPERPKPTINEIQCNACKQYGHFAGQCPNTAKNNNTQRELSSVLCFRCGEHGHYANICTNQKREPPPGGWPGQPTQPRGAKRPRGENF